jgi:hypothetical protein
MDLQEIRTAIASAEATYEALTTDRHPKDVDALMQIAKELRLLRILLAPQLTED